MISWDDIELKGRTSGTVKTTCPNCSHTRKKKKDPCLSVNLDKGAAKCWHCDEISLRERLEETKSYDTPPQQWENHTTLNRKMVEFFKGRSISQNTLVANRITEEDHFQPQLQKKVPCIVFNYFEGRDLVNKKYRGPKKSFTQTKNAKKIFYGINDIVDQDQIYIVEGEMDKLAMYEAGITNCISVPNGANDLNDVFENCERYIKEVKEFIIAVDMDEPGKKLEQALIKRLGKHRCKRVHFHGKDANEDLISGKLGTSLKNLEPYPVEGTYTANDVKVDIWKLYEHGHEKPLRPKGPEWEDFNKEFSILPGQLTIVTGIPGHGKSNWLEWYILNLIHTNGLKASFFSPEHLPLADHHAQLAEKFIGRPFYNNTRSALKMTPEELQSYQDWSSENIFLTAPEGGKPANWDWIFERWEEQIFRYGVDVFVIDAFNKVARKEPDSSGEINHVLARLTSFSQFHSVNLFVVVHPRKMNKRSDETFAIPTLYDCRGTSEFYDQTHNGLTVYRYYKEGQTSVIPTKVKFKHQGQTGMEIPFKFNESNGRYYPVNSSPNFEPLIINAQHENFNPQPIIVDQDHWLSNDEDADDELPF